MRADYLLRRYNDEHKLYCPRSDEQVTRPQSGLLCKHRMADLPFVNMISLPSLRSCSARRYSSPRTAYSVFRTLSFNREGWSTFPSSSWGRLASLCAAATLAKDLSAAACCLFCTWMERDSNRTSFSQLLDIVFSAKEYARSRQMLAGSSVFTWVNARIRTGETWRLKHSKRPQ